MPCQSLITSLVLYIDADYALAQLHRRSHILTYPTTSGSQQSTEQVL